MNKWSEIKQATLNKLFLEEEEAKSQGYLEKFNYLSNECLNFISNGVKPKINVFETTTTTENQLVDMPDDFLSFADMIGYFTVNGTTIADPTLSYYGDKKLMLHDIGTYKIFYNALWQNISNEDINLDNELDIDQSVLNCIPSYIASQLLSEDDVQRSVMLKNEFELLLSRLDINIMYQSNHYKSEGGWY